MISLSGVTKRYGSQETVRDISFCVQRGETVGLLGQNGAGKTTTLNMLTGYLAPSSGVITVDGHDLFTEPRAARRCIGYLPEQPPLYDEMTVRSFLRFVCELRLVVRADIDAHIEEIAALTNLSDMLGRRIGNLSKGYRQRVGLAQALCANPDVLVLDEPTVGLDPRQTVEFRETLRKLASGRTILLSSHILSEVQSLCDRVLILHHGRIVCDKTLSTLNSGNTRLRAAIRGDEKTLLPALRSLPSVLRVSRQAPSAPGLCEVVLECKSGHAPHEELFTLLCGLQMPLIRLQPMENTLEEIFLRCTTEA